MLGTPERIRVDVADRAQAGTLNMEGALIRYWDYAPVPRQDTGAADDGVGRVPQHARTILMVHGFRGDHHGLLRIVEALPQHRIIVPDLPGFGESAPFTHRPHDVRGYADFIGSLLAQLGLGPQTVLLGHSFGSIVASHFAAANPDRIGELVLVNPICEPALSGARGITSRVAELYYLVAARLPPGPGLMLLRSRIIVRVTSMLMAKTRDRVLRRFIHGQHDAYFSAFANRDVVLEAFRASIGGTVREVAPALAMPVLLIAAERDDLGSIPGQRHLAGLMPDAELHIIPRVGHLIHYETPAAAAALISDFLVRHPA